MLNSYPDIMTVHQLAEALGIGINTAYALTRDGTIGTKRIGRRILVPKLCVLDYLNSARYAISQR